MKLGSALATLALLTLAPTAPVSAGPIRLRRGKVVLCIYNESPNYYGRDPKTDTASEIVERTTTEN